MICKTSAMKCLLQLVFKSKSNTLRLGLSFPLLVICHIKIVKYINKKKKILETDNIYNRNKYRKFLVCLGLECKIYIVA